MIALNRQIVSNIKMVNSEKPTLNIVIIGGSSSHVGKMALVEMCLLKLGIITRGARSNYVSNPPTHLTEI